MDAHQLQKIEKKSSLVTYNEMITHFFLQRTLGKNSWGFMCLSAETIKQRLFSDNITGRCGGLMVSALVTGPGSRLGRSTAFCPSYLELS